MESWVGTQVAATAGQRGTGQLPVVQYIEKVVVHGKCGRGRHVCHVFLLAHDSAIFAHVNENLNFPAKSVRANTLYCQFAIIGSHTVDLIVNQSVCKPSQD